MVEVVLVMCGFRGFCVWNLRYSFAVSLARLFKAVKSWTFRAVVVERARQHERAVKRLGRRISLADAIVAWIRESCAIEGYTRTSQSGLAVQWQGRVLRLSENFVASSQTSRKVAIDFVNPVNLDFWQSLFQLHVSWNSHASVFHRRA